MKFNFKKIITLTLAIFLLSNSTVFAISSASESCFSDRLDPPVHIGLGYMANCDHMVQLWEIANEHINEATTAQNNIYLLEKELKQYEGDKDYAALGAACDGLVLGASLIGTPFSLGSLAALDAATLTAFIFDLSDINTANKEINRLAREIRYELYDLKRANEGIQRINSLLSEHEQRYKEVCHTWSISHWDDPVDDRVLAWPHVERIFN